MNKSEKGQVTRSAAEIYEEFFIPALFQEWANRVADAAHISPGQHILDVACGTGIVAREASHRVGATGSVVGLDLNEGMLAVAKRKAPELSGSRDMPRRSLLRAIASMLSFASLD